MVVLAEHLGSSPRSVIDAARQAVEERHQTDSEDPFEEIWVVFDTEGPQNATRQAEARNAIQRAHDLGYRTAVSNPCFEFWLLLHFEYYTSSLMDGAATCRALRRYIRDYDKGTNSYSLTREHLETALRHARRLFDERYFDNPHPCDCHPSTEIHHLIASLLAGYG